MIGNLFIMGDMCQFVSAVRSAVMDWRIDARVRSFESIGQTWSIARRDYNLYSKPEICLGEAKVRVVANSHVAWSSSDRVL